MASKLSKRRKSRHAAETANGSRRVGRRLIVPLAVIAILAAVSIVVLLRDGGEEATAAPLGGRPPVSFEPATFDFGELPPSTVHTESVRIINTGSGLLRLQTARSSCGCLRPEIGPVNIPPGSSVPLPLRIDSLSVPGVQSYTVSVFFSGYEDPAVLRVSRTTLE